MSVDGADREVASNARASVLPWIAAMVTALLVGVLGLALRHSGTSARLIVMAGVSASPPTSNAEPESVSTDERPFLVTLTVEDVDRGLSAVADDSPEPLLATVRCLATQLLAEEGRLFEMRDRHHRLTTQWLATGVEMIEIAPAVRRAGQRSERGGDEPGGMP